ncbi:hypothetical protein EV127DRAFT_507503 [Xylaria flabelliformis]|nr:hypothetical protein EV127DRAFT_507503 [Xylaria flabelliformis]
MATYADIKNSLAHFEVERMTFTNPPFLRQYLADGFCKRSKVKATLRSALGIQFPCKIDRLVTYVLNDAEKVFLTLVYMDEPGLISTLRDGKFTDRDLPVCIDDEHIFSRNHGLTHRNQPLWRCFNNGGWTTKKREDFCNKQWAFFAPTLGADHAKYTFEAERPLPFVSDGRGLKRGGFGFVVRATIPAEHQNYVKTLNRGGALSVAVKVLSINDPNVTDDREQYFFQREKKTLRAMVIANKDHLIKFHGTFKREIKKYNRNTVKGYERGFVFPWATGGNLLDYMEKQPVELDSEGQILPSALCWALDQIRGLADGIRGLHAVKARHGDIKPNNILLFPIPENQSKYRLVIADAGLAKIHELSTSKRSKFTTTIHASRMHQPPESDAMAVILSRRYDVWSFGCVVFEILVWLVRGPEEYKMFLRSMKGSPNGEVLPFWFRENKVKKLFPTVEKWKSCLLRSIHDERGLVPLKFKPSLSKLLRLVMTRLLVIDLGEKEEERRGKKHGDYRGTAYRADAVEMWEDIEKICGNDPLDFDQFRVSTLHELTRQSGSNADHDLNGMPEGSNNVHLSRNGTSKLRDQWEDVTDSRIAHGIASRLKLAPPAPSAEHSQLSICDQCKSINFLSNEINLDRDLEAMRTGSRRCSLCKVLHKALSKTSAATGGSFQLFRSESTWKIVSSSEPVLTVYSSLNPSVDISSYAQIGLPQLPRAGSREQFALLREWIRLCSETHACILQGQEDDKVTRMPIKLPTRLIEVGEADDNSSVRLVVNPPTTADDPTKYRYAALSHCWGAVGKDAYSCLLKINRLDFETRIPIERLPKMFQDAITATRGLEIRYLWIDSLCIVQDDDDDWAAESKTMEDVYSLAHVTLAASSAPSSLVGFLERPNRAFAVMPNPNAKDRDGDGSRSLLYVAEAIDNFQTHVEDAVLNTRAWVLQERALSRRTIHFTSTQVYWECGQGVHCETLAQLRNTVSHFLGDHHFPDGALSYFKNERILLIQYLYTRYSELSIKYGTDRPAAIQSLEARLGRTFGSLVAGGVFRKFFERTILWQAHFDGSLARVDYSGAQNGQTAPPSWSCLAYLGEIKFLDIPFGDVSWTGDLKNPLPTADYDDAAPIPNIISLDACARKITIKRFDIFVSVTLDTLEAVDEEFRQGLWRCITVGKDKTPNARGQAAYYVLLIRPVDRSRNIYERVGAGVLYTSEFSDEVEDVRLV